jgi:hypothetical protein
MQSKCILIAITVILSLSIFDRNNYSQASKKQQQSAHELDKHEVGTFVTTFLRSLDETKDIKKVPKSFFTSDFRKRFLQIEDWNFVDPTLSAKLAISERFNSQTIMFNFLYLGVITNFGRDNISVIEKNLEQMYPPIVIKAIKDNKTIAPFFNNTDLEPKIPNIEKFREFTVAYKTVVNVQRQYLNTLSAKEKAKYNRNIKKIRQTVKNFRSESCKEESCRGFAENTPLYWQVAFPLYIGMTKIKGKFKIFHIGLYGE